MSDEIPDSEDEWIACVPTSRDPAKVETEAPPPENAESSGPRAVLIDAIDAALFHLSEGNFWLAEKALNDARARVAKQHALKTDPAPFQDVWDGRKPFEIRRFDRDFRLGDELVLWEHVRIEPRRYTGRWIRAKITSMVTSGEYGVQAGFGVLGIAIVDKGGA